MQTSSLLPSRISQALLVLLFSLILTSTKEADPKSGTKDPRPQLDPSQIVLSSIKDNSRLLTEEAPSGNGIPIVQEPQHFFLSSHVQSEVDIEDQIHYYKAIVSPRDTQLTLTTSEAGSLDIFVSLDPQNRFPNQENCTISTVMTQTSTIELHEDDLNLLCARQFSGPCYLYVSVTPKSGRGTHDTYSLQLERTQQVALRKKPSTFLKDSQELYFPMPVTNNLPEVFYFYTVPYETSFVTVRCPGRKMSIYAQIVSDDKSSRSTIQEPNNTNYNYSTRSDRDSNADLVQLTIPAQRDEASIGIAVYFEDIEQNRETDSESVEMYTILLTSQIKPIIAGKQYYETLPPNQHHISMYDGLSQYYAFDVSNGTRNFIVSLEGSDNQDLTISLAAPNQELPTSSNSPYEAKIKNNAKIVEVTNTTSAGSALMAGTWIIRVNGSTSKNFTLTVSENKDDTTGNESEFMVLENGITYTQHLAPVGLNTYLFYVNKLDYFFLTINSTGFQLKLYISDNPTDDPDDDLWAFEIASPGKTQVLSLPGYEFYNNSLSSEYTTRWNGKENVKFKQKPVYLLVENPSSFDIDFDILFVSNERLWNRDFGYSFSIQPQTTLPLIMETPNSQEDSFFIEFQASADEYPQEQVLDITQYFWDEHAQQLPTETTRVFSYSVSIKRIYHLNNTYLIRQQFPVKNQEGRSILLVKNPLPTLINPLQVMVSNRESYRDDGYQVMSTTLILSPGVWSVWLSSCDEPLSEILVTSLSDPFWPEIKSSNLESEYSSQIPINTSGKYQVSRLKPGNEWSRVSLETAFLPLQNSTHSYKVRSQPLKLEPDVLEEGNNTKNISIRFRPLEIEDYDASADSVVYKIRVSAQNITGLCDDICYYNSKGYYMFQDLVSQNKTGLLNDRDEIQMNFELPRVQFCDRETWKIEGKYADKIYYTVIAEIMHYDQLIRPVLYQSEIVEFSEIRPTYQYDMTIVTIILAFLGLLVVVGLIIYYCWPRFCKKGIRHHGVRPIDNDNQDLREGVDAEDAIGASP